MPTPNDKGAAFESEVRDLLVTIQKLHPNSVTILEKPSIELQNGETVYPDFHLIVSYPHERRHYLIECQNREHNSKSILHKIQHVRAKQAFKTFFFLYPESIPEELARAFAAEGIVHQNVRSFRQFLDGLSGLLVALPSSETGNITQTHDRPDYAMSVVDSKREWEKRIGRELDEWRRRGFQ